MILVVQFSHISRSSKVSVTVRRSKSPHIWLLRQLLLADIIPYPNKSAAMEENLDCASYSIFIFACVLVLH